MATAKSNLNPRTVVIDARPRGFEGTYAEESVGGLSMLDRAVGLAETIAAGQSSIPTLVIHEKSLPANHLGWTEGPVPADSFVLRTDRLYDSKRLKRAFRRGADAETAVIWRLDRPGGLAGADDELKRRQSYQPLGKYWALPPARFIARVLCPTKIRPDAVTLAASTMMLLASGIVAVAGPSWRGNLVAAALMAFALVLDTADGHLARLQGTASEFGRHLDAWLDELCDMVLHAAIAWSAFARSGQAWWLVAGMAYAMGKYIFYVDVSVKQASKNEQNANAAGVRTSFARRVARFAGHADLRWHLWIVLAAVGKLDVVLLAYTVYYPARAVTSMAGQAKEVRHA